MPLTLGIPEALPLKPLLYGLENLGVNIIRNIPAKIALDFSHRTSPLDEGCAFLSPIDYARLGGEYLIVPDVGVSSSVPTGTIQLFVKSTVSNIITIAVDIRVTSEIILARIILQEKYRNIAASTGKMQFIPMFPNLDAMLTKADAALIANFTPSKSPHDRFFALDLVEEWHDLTEFPYVHGFWVGTEAQAGEDDVRALIRAKHDGVAHLDEIVQEVSREQELSVERTQQYFSSFSYGFGAEEQGSLAEFIHYAYFFGIIPDAPDNRFFPVAPPAAGKN